MIKYLITWAFLSNIAVAGIEEARAAKKAGDYSLALKEFSTLAEAGNAEAQFELGIMYVGGNGVEKDYVKAMNVIISSASKGFAPAQSALGEMYYQGAPFPVESNVDLARKNWILAADQGYVEAYYFLGKSYDKSLSVEDNPDETLAVKWYEHAALRDISLAQVLLGQMYNDGRGTQKDEVKAAYWFQRSADLNNSYGQILLGQYYKYGKGGLPVDFNKAIELYNKSAESNHPYAFKELGLMYLQGAGVKKDVHKAIELLEKSAYMGGSIDAGRNLSKIYRDGVDVPRDYVLALAWAHIGLDIGMIQSLAGKLSPAQRKKAELFADKFSSKQQTMMQ